MPVTIAIEARFYLEIFKDNIFLRTDAVLIEALSLSARVSGSKLKKDDRVFAGERLLVLDSDDRPHELLVSDEQYVVRDLSRSERLPELTAAIDLLRGSVAPDDEAGAALSDQGAIDPIEKQIRFLLEILEQESDDTDKATTLLIEIHELLDRGFDQMDEEAHLVSEATEMAIDQVQDMRISWLETPATTTYANIIMSAILIVAFEYAAVAAVTTVLARSFRSWKHLPRRREMNRAVAADRKNLAQGPAKLSTISRARASADLDYRRAAASVIESRTFSRHSSGAALFSRKADAQEALRLHKALERAELNREYEELEKALPKLAKKLRNFDAQATIGNELKEMILAPALEIQFAKMGKFSGSSMKEIAKGLSSKKTRAGGVPKEKVGNGDSPSTLARMQARRMTTRSSLEINGVRRVLDRMVLLALTQPSAIPDTLAHCRSLLEFVIWPTEAPEAYENGVRELSLDIELSLWALILPDLKISDMKFLDFIKTSSEGSDQVQFGDFRTTVKGLKNHMLGYYMARFSKKLGFKKIENPEKIDPEKNDLDQMLFADKFVAEMRKRRKLFSDTAEEILKMGEADNESAFDDSEGSSVKDSVLFESDDQSMVDNGIEDGMSTEPQNP